VSTRLLAAGFLIASAWIAWLSISFAVVARLLQAAIAISMAYVGYLAWHGHRSMQRARSGEAQSAPEPERLPWVTIIVPARNEAVVIGDSVKRLLAVAYGTVGEPRYDIVVIDDGSTDDTGGLARAAAATDASAAERVRVLCRETGEGPATKGGVLAFATPFARGDVFAVLDADAEVAPDFLSRAMSAWQRDPDAAALQLQRRASNPRGGWLVAAQDTEQLMDMAAQCGRRAAGGAAELRGNGMLVRREALARLGGWNGAALTEDLDLATRLAAAGEHVALAPEVEVREEAAEELGVLWTQRLRWAEGSLRRVLEHGPGLVASGAVRTGRKLDFLAFSAEFLIPPLFVAATAASLITIPLPQPADWTVPASLFAGYGIGTFLLALAGLAAHGVRGRPLITSAIRGALFLSHWLLIVPAALARIAIGPRTGSFLQTPRHARPSGR